MKLFHTECCASGNIRYGIQLLPQQPCDLHNRTDHFRIIPKFPILHQNNSTWKTIYTKY